MMEQVEQCSTCSAKNQIKMLEWLESKKKLQLKPASYDRLYSSVMNHVLPKIGDIAVSDVNSNMIQKEVIAPLFEKGLSLSSIRKVYQALNNFFEQLILEDKLTKNPLRGVVLPKESKFADVKEIRALNSEEIKCLVDTATRKYNSVNKHVYRLGYYYLFILYTGIRCGEALALQWKHVDLENRELHIEQNMVMARNKEGRRRMQLQTTKTKKSTRIVYLNAKAVEYFQAHKAMYYKGDDNDFVATSRDGNIITTRNFEKYLNYIYASAGIEAKGVHVLRHTFCSLLFSKGCDIKYISHQLGHSSVGITLNIYTHILKETENRYRELLDTL